MKRCNDILGEGSLDFDLAWYLKKKEHSYKEKSIGHTLRKKKVTEQIFGIVIFI